ncbi:MAG: NYN domain-containing protein [Thermoguttaceae bacterium]|jgi:uncharacterized LabA/DUF88 family protein
MLQEPSTKRTVAFFDGQNLFHHARDAFGYEYPNYSPLALASQICIKRGLNLHGIRFYTGIPTSHDDSFWNSFWSAKLLDMSRKGIVVFSRPLRYRSKKIKIAKDIEISTVIGEEKGIDIRIALDIIRMVRKNELDVVLLFSQDQDFSEVADEVRVFAAEQNRWIKIMSAFPLSPTSSNKRGINKTDWISIDRATYDACIDPRDYRPKRRDIGP